MPKRKLAPVEEIVEQGLMVADVAVRMSVKNEIIMNALGRDVNFDKDEILELVRKSTENLAEERERDALHIQRIRHEIKRSGRSTWSESSSYDGGDNSTLKHRQEVYEGVAAELRKRAQDEEFLRARAESAHELAWEEIGTSLKDRAEHPYYSGGHTQEYRDERESRIQLLIQKDLTELMQQQEPNKSAKKRKIFGRSS